MMIEDGTGAGYRAEVNSLHQIRTRSVGSTYQQFASCEHEQAYMASLGTEALPTLTVTGTGGYMMYVKNNSTDYAAIMSRITVSTSAIMTITLMKNPTIGSLGNETTITPINKNFGSGKVAEIDVYGWDEVGDGMTGITAGDCAGTYQINGFERLIVDEAVCLGINDVLAVKAKGAGEASIVMHGYYVIAL